MANKTRYVIQRGKARYRWEDKLNRPVWGRVRPTVWTNRRDAEGVARIYGGQVVTEREQVQG